MWPRRVKTSRPVSGSQSLIVRSQLEVAIRRPSGLKAIPTHFRGVADQRVEHMAALRVEDFDRVFRVLLAAIGHRPSARPGPDADDQLAIGARHRRGAEPRGNTVGGRYSSRELVGVDAGQRGVRARPCSGPSPSWSRPRPVCQRGGDDAPPVAAIRTGGPPSPYARRRRPGGSLRRSQTFIVPSRPPDASSRPSGAKATACTKSVWPWNTPIGRPLGTSQSRTLRSSLVEARERPSGLKARSRTNPSWPKIVSCLLAGGRVPELDRAVPAAGGQPFPVGAERDAVDPLGMPSEIVDFRASHDVPDLDDLRAGDRQVPAVGVEGQVVDTTLRAWEPCPLPGRSAPRRA